MIMTDPTVRSLIDYWNVPPLVLRWRAAVRRDRRLTYAQRVVAAEIADLANRDGSWRKLSAQRLGRDLGINPGTVAEAYRDLIRCGWLITGPPGNHMAWRLAIPLQGGGDDHG